MEPSDKIAECTLQFIYSCDGRLPITRRPWVSGPLHPRQIFVSKSDDLFSKIVITLLLVN